VADTYILLPESALAIQPVPQGTTLDLAPSVLRQLNARPVDRNSLPHLADLDRRSRR